MLTTDYDLTYKLIRENEPEYVDVIADFGVTLPIPDVLTASLYRADIHAKYFPHADLPDTLRNQIGTAAEQNIPNAQDRMRSLRENRSRENKIPDLRLGHL